MNLKQCSKCSQVSKLDAIFCSICGQVFAPQAPQSPPPPNPSNSPPPPAPPPIGQTFPPPPVMPSPPPVAQPLPPQNPAPSIPLANNQNPVMNPNLQMPQAPHPSVALGAGTPPIPPLPHHVNMVDGSGQLPPKGSKKGLLIGVAVLILLLLGGGLAAFFFLRTNPEVVAGLTCDTSSEIDYLDRAENDADAFTEEQWAEITSKLSNTNLKGQLCSYEGRAYERYAFDEVQAYSDEFVPLFYSILTGKDNFCDTLNEAKLAEFNQGWNDDQDEPEAGVATKNYIYVAVDRGDNTDLRQAFKTAGIELHRGKSPCR